MKKVFLSTALVVTTAISLTSCFDKKNKEGEEPVTTTTETTKSLEDSLAITKPEDSVKTSKEAIDKKTTDAVVNEKEEKKEVKQETTPKVEEKKAETPAKK